MKPRSKELVRAAINMGHSLGLMTLAEGIETKEQLEILRALGCQHGQGFLFSPGNSGKPDQRCAAAPWQSKPPGHCLTGCTAPSANTG